MSGGNDIEVIRARGRKQASVEDLLGFEPIDQDGYLLTEQGTATGEVVLGAGGNLRITDFNNLVSKMKSEGVMQDG